MLTLADKGGGGVTIFYQKVRKIQIYAESVFIKVKLCNSKITLRMFNIIDCTFSCEHFLGQISLETHKNVHLYEFGMTNVQTKKIILNGWIK